METRDRVGVLETVIGYAVDYFFLPECATMLREIAFRLYPDVFHWAIYGD